jgi:hypothetical protein
VLCRDPERLPHPRTVRFEKKVSRTRDYCVAKNATRRAARPDPTLRKERLLRMTNKLQVFLETDAGELRRGRERPHFTAIAEG